MSSLALKVLRQRNPNRMACDGWQEVGDSGAIPYIGVCACVHVCVCVCLCRLMDTACRRQQHKSG